MILEKNIQILHTLSRRPLSLVGVSLFFILLLMGIFAPVLAPYSPQDVNPANRLLPPQRSHLFGTDQYGRDVLSRVMYGSRISLLIGLSVTIFALFTGTFVGLISGYFHKLGVALMRFVDCLMALPSIMLALALLAIFGRGLVTVVIAVGIVYATRTARIAYSLTLTIREETYVQSARATGVGTLQILTKHILLNAVSPLIVQGTFVFAFSILEVASLNFLGIGIPPYIPSWGADMSLSRVYMTRAPWTLIFPGLFIIASVLSLNLMGDALRDVLDPRLKNIL